MLAIYFVTVSLLCLTAGRAAFVAHSLGIPPLLASGVVTATIVYGSSLLPGALGVFHSSTIYAVATATCLALLFAFAKRSPTQPRQAGSLHPSLPAARLGDSPTWADAVVGAIGLVGVTPLFIVLWQLPAALIHPESPLAWDTVSYHLPGFIEFWQHHSLWSMEGPYQSYSFAFELIGNFLSHPFFAHWGLRLAHAFAIALLVAAMATIGKQMAGTDRSPKGTSWTRRSATLFAVGFWASIFPTELIQIGKNDVFMTAGLVAALAFTLQVGQADRDGNARNRLLVVLAALALGLAVGTKPSALAFVPFFAGAAALLHSGGSGLDRASIRRAITARPNALPAMVMVVSISLLLGGFWLARNVLMLGQLSPIKGAWRTTLAANLGRPSLYDLNPSSTLFLVGLLAIVPASLLARSSRRSGASATPLRLLLGFHLVACAAFALTPHVVARQGLSTSAWQLRLGMPLFVSAGIIYGFMLIALSASFTRLRRSTQAVLASLALLALLAVWPYRWRAIHVPDAAAHLRVKGLPATQAYDWIARQEPPLRIYAAGLRPYGLYGPGWQNTLFYDLHSTAMADIEAGVARIAVVANEFRPDLIAISVDPHPYTGGPAKPITVQWMQQRPALFEEVFSDETVSIFRVDARAAEALRPHLIDGYMLRSGG